MENHKPAPIAKSAEEGTIISMAGNTYRMLVTGAETGGAFAVMDFLIPPGGGPGPHAHPDFQESFYVVEGEIEFKSEAGTYIAKKGAFVTIPKGGIVHQFKNKTDKSAQMTCTVVPAGLEDFFMEIGKPVINGIIPPPAPLDAEAIKKIEDRAKKYKQQLLPPDYLDR
ncbi:MAG: cupin domain-containing protein [Mucilaginibacter sp.]|uniref:cupin domain-containing protein n=1 Tax=Mucilaginibacter sp. TaxID=1882438 RepID=UPI0031AC856B